MISIQLPTVLTEEFIALIPKQRKRINQLVDEGKILHYSLAKNRSHLWTTVKADSRKEAMELISTFPLSNFMKPEIFDLAFHTGISTELPKLIMN